MQIDANKMLDHSGQAEANEEMERIKNKIRSLLQKDYSSVEELIKHVAPLGTKSIVDALRKIQSPKDALGKIHDLIKNVKNEIKDIVMDKGK